MAARANLRTLGLIREAEQFADGLRLISLGLDALGYKGGGVTASANEISKRLVEIGKTLRGPNAK
jgi:hypothetical protein